MLTLTIFFFDRNIDIFVMLLCTVKYKFSLDHTAKKVQ